MIQTKLFTGHFEGEIGTRERKFIDVDEEINEFISEYGIEVIDIKLNTTVDSDGDSWNHALVIYRLLN